jgi:hypothetical protein
LQGVNMRVPSWRKPWQPIRRTVAGLAFQPDGVDGVILTGSVSAPDAVCRVERWHAASARQPLGAAPWDVEVFGQRLSAFLQAHGQPLDGLCVCVDDAWVNTYTIDLPQVLRGDDLDFQLMAELDALHPAGLSQMRVAYTRMDEGSSTEQTAAVQPYRVGVMAQAHVEALEQMARRAGMRVVAIEAATDARQRTRDHEFQSVLPSGTLALGWRSEAALGAALSLWTGTGLSFSPSRAQHTRHTRHVWAVRTAASASAGVFLGCVAAWALGWALPQDAQPDPLASQRALDAAKQEAAALQTQWQQAQALTQWWRSQTTAQQHSVQWSRVLVQASHGIWVSQLEQQNGHWVVQGEALSSAHVHQLLQALAALDIWHHAPDVQRLQLMHGSARPGVFTWQFRIEADLKDSV